MSTNNTGFGSLFKKVVEAKANEGGVYVEPGLYFVEVVALKMVRTFRGIDMFIAELLILASNNDARPVGSTMSWTAGFDKPSTPGNVKGFFEAMFPGEVVDESGMETAVSEANPCAGARLHIEAVHVPTKNGGVYTKCKFRLLSEEEEAQLVEA